MLASSTAPIARRLPEPRAAIAGAGIDIGHDLATMSFRQRLGNFMLRKILFFLVIAWLGCSAAPPPANPGPAADAAQSAPADLNRRIERTVRAEFKIPSYVQISIGAPTPSEFPNYDNITVSFATEEKKQSHEFLISKDGKQLIDMRKMDLSVDPYPRQ